jgi:RNA polymerase sigma factor (sigma-70 family)
MGGDPAAQEEVWDITSHEIAECTQVVCCKWRLPYHDVPDIAQDVLVRLIENPPWRDLLARCNRKGWFYTVVTHAVIDYLRRKRRRESRVALKLDAPLPGDPDSPTYVDTMGWDDPAIREFIVSDEYDCLMACVGEKVPAERIRIFRMFVDGYSYRDISEIVEAPLNTIGVVIHRVRQHLQDCYRELQRREAR